ncbi:hypothetical protein [Hydrogenimonas thermophila]|uniref:Uncharacterized protein n=1 Tax=Hydrogenimonas thermophila TaxID=223786 RepID=A0A1I5N872_9BACT|nr:hypothetical protein [Hydrogenimonas thermophila]SFP18105.1 hypothetical protein SAMN05216234_10913 [Hydrogenimonas thermophila]
MTQTEIKKIVKSITIECVKDELHQLKVLGQKFDEAIDDDNKELADELLDKSYDIVNFIIKKITPAGFVAKELPNNPLMSWESFCVAFYNDYTAFNMDNNGQKALFAVDITSCKHISHSIHIKSEDFSYWEELG